MGALIQYPRSAANKASFGNLRILGQTFSSFLFSLGDATPIAAIPSPSFISGPSSGQPVLVDSPPRSEPDAPSKTPAVHGVVSVAEVWLVLLRFKECSHCEGFGWVMLGYKLRTLNRLIPSRWTLD